MTRSILAALALVALSGCVAENKSPEACRALCDRASLPVASFERFDHCVCGTQPYVDARTTTVTQPIVVGGSR